MNNGISIYPGLDNTLEENLDLITEAAHYGLKRLFTSLHVPETDTKRFRDELGVLLKKARNLGMEIISDISPLTLDMLDIKDFKPSSFRMFGITTLRLDDGFSPDEIARFTHADPKMRVQLNASTMTSPLLRKLKELGADFSRVDALYNFYPRPGTGLAVETLVHRNMMLHRMGISVGAFVPSMARPRSPIYAGLPTLEEHRGVDAGLAARHLVALGCDSVFLADSLPTTNELRTLGALKGDQVTLKIRTNIKDPLTEKILAATYTARLDEARDAIRATESRARIKEAGAIIEPANTAPRSVGAVTLDNKRYGRYMGELQIIRNAQDADEKTNVIATIDEKEVDLIQYITPGRRFAFLREYAAAKPAK